MFAYANITVCIPTLEASFEAGQQNQQPADYLPMPMLEAGCSSFVSRASATRCVECFQCPTLEVFDASCSRSFYRVCAARVVILITVSKICIYLANSLSTVEFEYGLYRS